MSVVDILGTVDSDGTLLLNNYQIGIVGEVGSNKIIITVNSKIAESIDHYTFEFTYGDGRFYESLPVSIDSNHKVSWTVNPLVAQINCITKFRLVGYNLDNTKWKSSAAVMRVVGQLEARKFTPTEDIIMYNHTMTLVADDYQVPISFVSYKQREYTLSDLAEVYNDKYIQISGYYSRLGDSTDDLLCYVSGRDGSLLLCIGSSPEDIEWSSEITEIRNYNVINN